MAANHPRRRAIFGRLSSARAGVVADQLRLMGLLEDLVGERGHMEAAKVLGVNYKTLAGASIRGGSRSRCATHGSGGWRREMVPPKRKAYREHDPLIVTGEPVGHSPSAAHGKVLLSP